MFVDREKIASIPNTQKHGPKGSSPAFSCDELPEIFGSLWAHIGIKLQGMCMAL
jgi:hypothetical protein